uniref:Uncharacterized protein n=1 Tax=Ditylenchus dipsaci TaxID=166011 RepID=A0A915CW56_9BILA
MYSKKFHVKAHQRLKAVDDALRQVSTTTLDSDRDSLSQYSIHSAVIAEEPEFSETSSRKESFNVPNLQLPSPPESDDQDDKENKAKSETPRPGWMTREPPKMVLNHQSWSRNPLNGLELCTVVLFTHLIYLNSCSNFNNYINSPIYVLGGGTQVVKTGTLRSVVLPPPRGDQNRCGRSRYRFRVSSAGSPHPFDHPVG